MKITMPAALISLAVAAPLTAWFAPEVIYTKELGRPTALEWISIESNTAGSPPATFAVPAGQALTLSHVHVSGAGSWGSSGSMNGQIDASPPIYGRLWSGTLGNSSNVSSSSLPSFEAGTILFPGEILTIERSDSGASGAPGTYMDDAATFVVRGYLEPLLR